MGYSDNSVMTCHYMYCMDIFVWALNLLYEELFAWVVFFSLMQKKFAHPYSWSTAWTQFKWQSLATDLIYIDSFEWATHAIDMTNIGSPCIYEHLLCPCILIICTNSSCVACMLASSYLGINHLPVVFLSLRSVIKVKLSGF